MPKNYNFSRGFLSLIGLLTTLIIIVILMFGIYFGFDKLRFGKSNQSDQPEQLTPQEEIEKAKQAKKLLENQQEALQESINKELQK